MSTPYTLNLEAFSLARLQDILETGDVLPGRRILKEHLAERFAFLESMGIGNLKALIDVLSTPKKVAAFSQRSGLPEDYLTILGRQARSYVPGPVYLKDIPGLDPAYVAALAAIGIRQTKQLFERTVSPQERDAVCRLTKIPAQALLEMVQLSDLVRAGWVGPIFARLLYEAGARTLQQLTSASPDELFERAQAINHEQHLTRASFSSKDVAACIEMAKELPQDIQY